MNSVQKARLKVLKNKSFTPFEIGVYRAVCSIPWGETRSYAWVAGKLRSPASSRAVGRALNKNPFTLIIPCHRVIRQDGSTGGFSEGNKLKKRLLELEKVDIIDKTSK